MQVFANTLDIDRNQWLELRRKGIGGSDASAILGINPWSSAMDVWLEKTGEFEGENNDNEKMYWGNVLEDIVAKEFSIRTGLRVRRRNAMLKHKEYPFMLANVDRLIIGQKAGLECKTAGQYSADDWAMGIPEHYKAQVQHYMAVTGYDTWYVAVLIGGQEFKHFKITRDEQFIKELIKAEVDFWNKVQTKTPPPLDGSEASGEVLKRLYPEAERGTEKELPHEAYELILKHDQACEEEKKIKLIKDEAANKIKNMLGTAEKGFIHDKKISWTNVSSKRFDSKKLQIEQPEIYDQYVNESSYRRFSIK